MTPGPEQAWTAAASSVLAHVRSALGFDMAVVSRRSGDRYVVLGADDARYGVSAGDVLPWDDTFCARVVDGRAPQVAPDIALVPAHLEAAAALGMQVGAYVSVPLRDEAGELLGTLCAASPVPRGPELHAAHGLLLVLADVLGTLLASELRLQREVRRAEQAELTALADPLTGLGNRRAWDHRSAAEERRCAAFGLSAAVVVVDLDGLKSVNDSQGHDAGDALLCAAAAALRDVVGPDDVATRTGGDEFVLLLPETGADRLAAVVEALRAALTARGLSAGVGAALRTAAGLGAAWREADARMLVDKTRSGTRSRRRGDDPTPAGGPPPVVTPLAPHTEADELLLRELLDLARRQLGASIAFVGEFRGGASGVRVLRALSGRTPPGIEPGWSEPLAVTYCQRILDGRLPRVINDAAALPEAAGLEITAALPIGSYVGVPVLLSDGTLYGTLCCLSHGPDPALSDRDADFLAAVAQSIARVLEGERSALSVRRGLVARLSPVLRGEGLTTVYQPIVAMRDGALVGTEALSRFGADGAGAPSRWFLDAEAAGLGPELELAAARTALAGAAALPGFLALNFSATTIAGPGFAALLAGVDPARVVVEVSEHEEVADYAPVLAALQPLRQRGLRVAVDDAGAGFASLRHVVLLAPDIIKLDISLVRGIDADPVRQALAAALTTFARSTGAAVVAEGVETEQERDVLAVAGVGLLQGWLTGAGTSAGEVARRYGRRTAVPPPRPGSAPVAVR